MAGEQRFVEVEEDVRPSEESIERLDEQSRAEVRTCAACGDPVTTGMRVEQLREDGESVWRHDMCPNEE